MAFETVSSMSRSDSPNVVITGCGWVTPFAVGNIEAVLHALARTNLQGLAGNAASCHRSVGPEESSCVPSSKSSSQAEATVRFNPTAPTVAPRMRSVPDALLEPIGSLPADLAKDRDSKLAAVALELAIREAQMRPSTATPERMGMVLGCALAGQLGMIEFAGEVRAQGTRFVSPIHFPQTVGNYVAGALARGYQWRGPNLTVAGGAASSLIAIREAWALIASGEADVVVAGGMERWSAELASGMAAANPGRPTPSDGACLMVLEAETSAVARGATPLAFLCSSADPLALTSMVGDFAADAVCIETWMGWCPGAAGAAAVAAAIGAAWGLEVPWGDGSATSSRATTRHSSPIVESRPRSVAVHASVVAVENETRTELLIQVQASRELEFART